MSLLQDEKELIKNLSSAIEGPEPLVEADEYLQPKGKIATVSLSNTATSMGMDTQTTNSLKPSGSSPWTTNVTNNGLSSEGSTKQEIWDHELLRFSQQNPGVEIRHYYNNGICASDSSSSRYCSDPMKDSDGENIAKIKEAQVGNLKLNLPLDEDDYLMPSLQHNQNASAYMDLIGENSEENVLKELRGFTGFVGLNSKRCIDNPEYLMSDESIPTQTLGIPVEPIESPCVSEVSSGNEPTSGQSVGKYIPQKSMEEESMSDHEYYNDLQRELQPLRKNETTV